MAEYIVREALRDALYDADAITMEGVKTLNQFPAADVEPVRHAHWDKNGRCTACGGHAPYFAMSREYYKSPVCHERGAIMDEEVAE